MTVFRIFQIILLCSILLAFQSCNNETTMNRQSSSQNNLTSSRSAPVSISGAHQTNPIDNGRPVLLIASALGVEEQVFRDAFSGVNPAPGGTQPTRERERANKKVLMDALGPYGISNSRLDEVSNYYRYRPQSGELWPFQEAEILAMIESDKVTEFKIIRPGHGYVSVPQITIVGFPDIQAEVQLGFSNQFEENGRITGVSLSPQAE